MTGAIVKQFFQEVADVRVANFGGLAGGKIWMGTGEFWRITRRTRSKH